jgi:AraC-like DNA-binding protein
LDLYFNETAAVAPMGIAAIRRLDAGLSAWPSRSTLYYSTRLAIGVARSKAAGTGPGPEAVAQSHTISIVTRGVYRAHRADQFCAIDGTCAALFNNGDTFRISHPGGIGDDSIFVQFSDEVVRDSFERVGVAVDPLRFPTLGAPLRASAFIAIRSLVSHLQRDAGLGGLGCQIVEETALALLDDVVKTSMEASKRDRMATRNDTAALHSRLSEETRVLMATTPSSRRTIAEVAADLSCSPYHLCRVFRSCTGQPVHKYLNTLRLRLAIDRLCDPGNDLRTIAEDLGFASHSHFCDAFKREFGTSPSSMRSRLNDVGALVNAIR